MLKGLEYQSDQLFEWLQEFQYQKKRGFILRGNPGVGKTALVYDIGNEYDYNIIEFNASNERRKDFIDKLKSLSRQKMLNGETPIILLDEADGLSNKKSLKDIINKTQIPIILTCNDIKKLQSLRKFCRAIYVPKPNYADVGFMIQDHRQARLMQSGSQGYEVQPTQKSKILKMVRDGNYSGIDERDIILLLDSVPAELFGWETYRFIKGLECFDYCKRSECLSGLRARIKELHNTWYAKKYYTYR